jgi:hypothetical protein
MNRNSSDSMRAFFRDLAGDPREVDPEQLALAFGRHFWNHEQRQSDQAALWPVFSPQDNIHTSIVAEDTQLSFLARRVPLVSEVTVLTPTFAGGT